MPTTIIDYDGDPTSPRFAERSRVLPFTRPPVIIHCPRCAVPVHGRSEGEAVQAIVKHILHSHPAVLPFLGEGA